MSFKDLTFSSHCILLSKWKQGNKWNCKDWVSLKVKQNWNFVCSIGAPLLLKWSPFKCPSSYKEKLEERNLCKIADFLGFFPPPSSREML